MTAEFLGFTFTASTKGVVLIYHHGILATTLRSKKAAKFVNFAEHANDLELQHRMARLTGNYKKPV